jgi:hypothetical protein
MRVLGYNINVMIALVFIVIGMFLGSMMLCSCSRIGLKEGMAMLGAPLDYKMGEGVKGSWTSYPDKNGSSVDWRRHDHDSYLSEHVTPEQSMDFFAKTVFKPECCGSSYSASGGMNLQGATSGGCACLNKKQMDYLNTRGGNRTQGGSDF